MPKETAAWPRRGGGGGGGKPCPVPALPFLPNAHATTHMHTRTHVLCSFIPPTVLVCTVDLGACDWNLRLLTRGPQSEGGR